MTTAPVSSVNASVNAPVSAPVNADCVSTENVKAVYIVCRVAAGEIATTVEHAETERVRIQDAGDQGKATYVAIKARRFVAHSRTPFGCAEAVRSAAAQYYGPSVPVTLAFA